jgi:lipid-A-disaccharide synthase
MKYYLIAGERSGDLHASNLMKALLNEDNQAEFRYFGGDYMGAVAETMVVHNRELAFMGFWEVITNLNTIAKFIKLCKKDIEEYHPDAIILVDYAGFNLKIAKYAKKKGFKVLFYISPKIWAWNQKRALKIKARVDHMFSILPFEVEFYKKYDWHEVTYVGNPVVEAVNQHKVNNNFLAAHKLAATKKIIAVLPGSRKQELSHILPSIRDAIVDNPQYHFCIAAIKSLPADLYKMVNDLENTTLIFDETYDLLAHAHAAIITSGTATLETALWNVPQVVVYRANWVSYHIAKAMVMVDFISLVNLIMGKEVIKELIQDQCTAGNITHELEAIIKDGIDYSSLRQKLAGQIASEETAKLIIELTEGETTQG